MSSRLDSIEHIVVLMLENRSFDHLLGYLSLEAGRKVEGLTGNERNVHSGVSYKPEHLTNTVFEPDPKHDWEAVHEQIADGNSGFVSNFAKRARSDLGRVMGYHNATELPVYDLLARQYCVCDQWHASVPGPTQPNRFYAMAGTSEGRKENRTPPLLRARTVFHELTDAKVNWRYYSHDVAFLLAHPDFRRPNSPKEKIDAFFKAARAGSLPNICWIDPDFGIVPNFERANDDHPPHDVWEGQRLVGRVYNALLNGAGNLFSRVLFVITYDEHGGFYDHVEPGAAEDDREDFRQYGVRVPAFVVSAWTSPGSVCSDLFDHTSIIKTILERFCRDASGRIPQMGRRVAAASSLVSALDLDEARTDRPVAPILHRNLDIVRREASLDALREPTELQRDLEALREECLAMGMTDDEL